MNDTLTQAIARRVIPVVEIIDPAHAVPLAQALIAGGLPVAEITLRTPHALEAIKNITAAVPGFLVGAGSVITPDQIDLCVAAGASFAVSPGFTPEVCDAARRSRLPLIPGIATASELMAALRLGHRLIKFFPAGQLGGVRTIHSLAAPFATAGMQFMPTGGVTITNLADYLSEPSVAAVGGSWIASHTAIAEQDFAGISGRAATAVAAAAAV